MSSAPQPTDPLFGQGAVPVPNALFDEVLPTLKDTELRLLLVVLRQTAGWRDRQGRPKARDWLSHRQLVRRTGRGSEAISHAIAALVGRGLIVVEDSAGRALVDSAARRRHLGRLFFRPGESLANSSGPASKRGRGGHTSRVDKPPLVLHTSGWSRVGPPPERRPEGPSPA